MTSFFARLWFARLKHRCLVILRYFSITKEFWLRFLFCFGLGILLLFLNPDPKFDYRYRLRPERPIDQSIVLVTVPPRPYATGVEFRSHTEVDSQEFPDSYYFDPTLWVPFLENILKQHPARVGVNFFFEYHAKLSAKEIAVLYDPRIIWGAVTSQYGRTFFPSFSNEGASNVGALDFIRDSDGVVRHFLNLSSGVSHLAEKLADYPEVYPSRDINFQSPAKNFPVYSFADILQNRVPETALQNRIVIIGPQGANTYLTPVGLFSRAALTAQVTDNILNFRWIRPIPMSFLVLGLALLITFSLFVIFRFPAMIAILIMLLVAVLIASFSFWIFDQFNIFLPILAPNVMMLTCWVIFVGYQAARFERRTHELQSERHALRELDQLKNNFISLISHDLKTPLAKIKVVAERLLAGTVDEKQTKDLQNLRTYSDELLRYIQSILQLLQVETKNFKLRPEGGDVNEIVLKVMDQLAPLLRLKKIAIETQLEPLFAIEADFVLIHEVILNVVENAIKYSPEGGKIVITSYEKNDFVHLEVSDQGGGIPEEELSKIWKKFYRVEDSLQNAAGSGLGLYLVKYFVEIHGGMISVFSEVGRGTKFHIALPFEISSSRDQA